MRRIAFIPRIGVCLAATALMAACVDKSYDLDDVDFTLGTNADLTFPSCSTGDITMKNIMDLKEDGVVKEIWDGTDSIFCVRQTGSAHIDPVSIDEIRIKAPQVKPFTTTVRYESNDSRQSGKRKSKEIHIDYGGLPLDFTIENMTYRYVLQPTDARCEVNPTKATGISSDVLRIEEIKIVENTLSVHIGISGLPAYLKTLHADNLALHLPPMMEVSSCTFQGKPAKDCGELEVGVIHLTDMEDNAFSIQEGIDLELTLAGLTTGEGFTFDYTTHTATLEGELSLSGTVRLETDDFDETELLKDKDKLIAFYRGGGDYTQLIPEEIILKGESSFQNDIVFDSFTGDIQHVVEKLDPIKLNDLPDFLNDPDVVLDLDNPIIYLHATNEMKADASTFLTLTSNYSDSMPVTRKTGVLTLRGAGETSYYLAGKESGKQETAIFSRVEDLGGLIRKIPNQINVAVDTIRMHCTDMNLRSKYNVSVDYEVYAPLTFGKDFQLVYRDSERGWIDKGDMDDLEKVNAEQLVMEAKAVSNLPADVSLTLIPLDKQGNRIPQLLVNSVTVAKNTTSSISLCIKAAEGYTLNDAFAGNNGVKKLDGLTYEARVMSAEEGKVLSTSACVRLTDAKVSIKGKVEYDAN